MGLAQAHVYTQTTLNHSEGKDYDQARDEDCDSTQVLRHHRRDAPELEQSSGHHRCKRKRQHVDHRLELDGQVEHDHAEIEGAM